MKKQSPKQPHPNQHNPQHQNHPNPQNHTNNPQLHLPKIALGAWAWGNDGTFGSNLSSPQLKPIFTTALKNGLNLWDTAYAYGMGTSEKILAGFIHELKNRENIIISDKFTPQCVSEKTPDVSSMYKMQLNLMNIKKFDIYWIHNV